MTKIILEEYKEKKVTIDDLNTLRAFAILLVVLRHCFAPYMGIWPISEYYSYDLLTDITGKYISTISMPLFVFISGFLFSYLRNNLKKYPNFQILVSKKIARLLRPYIILAPIYILIFVDINSILDFINPLWKGAGHLWFLLMIFLVFILFYPLEKYFKKKPYECFFLIILCFFLYPGFSIIGLSPLSKVFHYLPFFYLGYFFHFKSKKIIEKIENKLWVIILIHTILFITSILAPKLITNGILKTLFNAYINLPLGIMSVSILFLIFTKSKKLKTMGHSLIVKKLNQTSYYIYLLHQPILLFIFQIKFLQTLPPLLVILSALISTVIISFFIASFLLKFYWSKKLIGAA